MPKAGQSPAGDDEQVLETFIKNPRAHDAASGFQSRFGPFLTLVSSDARDLAERGLAEDVRAEAVLMVMTGARTYHHGGHPQGFLRLVVKDAARTVRRRNRLIVGAPPRPAAPPPAGPVRIRYLDRPARPSSAPTPVVSYVPTLSEIRRSMSTPGYLEGEPPSWTARRNRSGGQAAPSAAAVALSDLACRDILTRARRTSSPLTAPALVAAAVGVPWTAIGSSLGRDPATLKYHVRQLRRDQH